MFRRAIPVVCPARRCTTRIDTSCHGVDGQGDGPAGPALKMPPTNLSTLRVKNGGVFPEAHVAAAIQGTAMTAAHGSKEMPVWGTGLFDNGQS